MNSLELFAGAGGLGLGISHAGFSHLGVLEWDRWACETIRENRERGIAHVKDWPLFEGDVRDFKFASLKGRVQLVSGGPPCQPFSIGGKHKAFHDDRNMFPATVNAVRSVRPKAFLVENVRGLARPAFANYLQYIQLQFTFPEVAQRREESWLEHLSRLERYKTGGERSGLWYRVVVRVLNAANYGVPQRRERVFIVGFRSDLNTEWSFPDPTHSQHALWVDQWVTGEYWERHRIASKNRPPASEAVRQRMYALRDMNALELQPWRTVRDAIADLPPPKVKACEVPNHILQLGARSYAGHTGSPIDEPAKTLKAGDHGVPGGENTVALPDGSVRYFTVREAARIQTFPDEYVFHGSWTETMRQLGNAVPVRLAQVVAESIAKRLDKPNRRPTQR
jgi:DNA (cytosine-5)-methyltransferase 1